MALSDFITNSGNFNGNGPYPALGQTTVTPIAGTKSLAMASTAGEASNSVGYIIQDVQPHGFLSGKIRCFINPVVSGPANHGVFAMASSTDLLGGSGTKGYACLLDSVFFNNNAQIVYFEDGISGSIGGAGGSSYTSLGQSSNGIWSTGTPVAIELEWHVNIAVLNGVHVIGRFGSDFNNLAVFAEGIHVGPTAATGPSSGEGVFAKKITNTMSVLFDSVQVFEMPEI